MTIPEYIDSLNKRFRSGIASEHSYRADLEMLISHLVPQVVITNEPSHITDCGNPDYVITRGQVPVGYIEAKDLGKDLNNKIYKEQFGRYKKALDNLIITDYIRFQFFQNGELTAEIHIAEIEGNTLKPLPDNFSPFQNLIENFCTFIGQTIKSSKRLAGLMASKARLLQNILERALTSDEQTSDNTSLKSQFASFKKILIHDLNPKEFADIYAQTLAYGMFAARLHDPSPNSFSRHEAAELIPKSNPFLRKLFQYVAGYDIDERIKPTVDNLADVFRATNVEEMLKNFGKSTQQHDPIIHFYETFLTEYDPTLRKARGVWYTPAPVVNFIVRAVDDILKQEFALPLGLADTAKTTLPLPVPGTTKTTVHEVHKVQILDPATGTGTFLAEVVKHIYHNNFASMQGAWSSYIEDHLIPRLNGFEILMASYTIAHLKLDMLLAETGYKPKKEHRFNIYLTNSLEEYDIDTGTIFANWLSTEANEANHIKRDTPVMVVLGNPPYSGESSNKGEWIMNLMEEYKKEPGGKEKLNERNPKWINDDYVKFIRYAQYYIEKNGSGVLAFINPHGFLDNPTFRGMRWNLLHTFDKIYTLDLHGNTKKKETTPDGGTDENVFDIQQGVSINILVKTGQKKTGELGKVFHHDLFGKREYKYDFLNTNSLHTIPYQEIPNKAPMYFMVQKDLKFLNEYDQGISLSNLFTLNSLGLLTKRDKFITDYSKNEIKKRLLDFYNSDLSNEDLSIKYDLKLKDNDNWNLATARNAIQKIGINENSFRIQNYRCFDRRYIYYETNFVARLNTKVLRHLCDDNLALISTRQLSNSNFNHIFLTNIISDQCYISNKTKEGCQVFPLYIYPDDNQITFNQHTRIPNLDNEIVQKIAFTLGLTFTNEKDEMPDTFAPIDLLDYIYAVLHSPAYREKYKEFLKIDFPRVPYPKDAGTFRQLVQLGSRLRQIHLLESPEVNRFITRYPEDGSNEVSSITYRGNNVYINPQQYFAGVPETAWQFYIGGYQPAQKWLKDRKGRILSYEDILHYQKIIVALTETHRLMQEIDTVGWLS